MKFVAEGTRSIHEWERGHKALISSLANGDEAHFYSVAMQIAAHEARMGHGKLAEEIRSIIDKAKARTRLPSREPIPGVELCNVKTLRDNTMQATFSSRTASLNYS
jgi:hypothetical protein